MFVREAEVCSGTKPRAETYTCRCLGPPAGTRAAKIHQVDAFGVKGQMSAVAQCGEGIDAGEWNKPPAEPVVDLTTVMNRRCIGVPVYRNSDTHISREMELIETLFGRYEGIDNATTALLEDLFASGWGLEGDTRGNDVLLGFILGHCILEARSNISPPMQGLPALGVNFDVSVLRSDDRQPIVDRIAQLQGIDVYIRGDSQERRVHPVIHINRMHLRLDHGRLKEYRIGNGHRRLFLPARGSGIGTQRDHCGP